MSNHLSWDYEPSDDDPDGWYHVYDVDSWATDDGEILSRHGVGGWSFSIQAPQTEEMDAIISRFVNDLDRYIDEQVEAKPPREAE